MRASSVRAVLLFILFVALASVFVLFLPRGQNADPRLAWVATAHQFGPVGYRDPAGAISPDGKWIAYSEGRFLRVKPIDGGPILDLPPGPAQIRYIAWRPDSRAVTTDGDPSIGGYAIYDIVARTRGPLFAQAPSGIRQPAWSHDGTSIAALANGKEGNELWTFAASAGAPIDGSRGERVRTLSGAASFPAWTPSGEIACVINANGQSRVTVPCGGSTVHTSPDADAYGPIAFSADGNTVYVALANERGTVDLWAAPMNGRRGHRLSSFARDAYGPSVAADGSVLFKVQSYRTAVAMIAVDEGPAQAGRPVRGSLPLSTFQSETPSWDPTGRWLGITYGTWRRIPDDAKYPDIAQDAGIISVDPAKPATAPARVVHESMSEDQSLCWSPNGKWIAFHSHKDQSDDIWLRSASDTSEPPRRISFLGRGAETGWPRWSPDGQWLLFDGANKKHESVFFVIPIDQETGTTKGDAQEITVRGLDADMSHAEWLPDNLHIAGIAKEGPDRHVVFTVSREGGDAKIVHRFATEHDAPGLAVSPDGSAVAFIAPAADGFFQVFRMPLNGSAGTPTQITTDPTNKTQPAWSPDGKQIAFTVWNYDAQFWRLR